MAIYTVEIQGHTGAAVETFYAASDRLNTGAADVPANQHFHPSLETPANFERALFSAGATTGPATIGFGEIVLANAHGRYDAWPGYAFDGRPCLVKAIATDRATGKPLWSYRDAPVLIRGTVESVDVTDAFKTIRLRLYDRLADLDRPLLTTRYAGTTTSAGLGAEGTADLKDTLKPRVYGFKANFAPIDVNPFDLIRQVSDKAPRPRTCWRRRRPRSRPSGGDGRSRRPPRRRHPARRDRGLRGRRRAGAARAQGLGVGVLRSPP